MVEEMYVVDLWWGSQYQRSGIPESTYLVRMEVGL